MIYLGIVKCFFLIIRHTKPICSIVTEPFKSLHSREYNYLGGNLKKDFTRLESSEISKIFARQGIRIPITRKSSTYLSCLEPEGEKSDK